ncbi:helix-turn-helix domain-containing protein [Solidesulfovibrio sp.]|jgi:transcriptional regulator with XRE-family HTH domain
MDTVTIPFEVAELHLDGASLIQAWREYLGLTQDEVAQRLGVPVSAFAQMEAPDAHSDVATRKKIAEALGVNWQQLQVE